MLALCVFHKRHYSEKIIPALEKLKFNWFGHDSVVLHETEIRKQKGDFAFLSHLPTRIEFMNQLTHILVQSNFILIACVIDKVKLAAGTTASNPYHLALDMCLHRLHDLMAEKGQENLQTHVIVECRGKKEDRELELEFRRICAGDGAGAQPTIERGIRRKRRRSCQGARAYDARWPMAQPPRKRKAPVIPPRL